MTTRTLPAAPEVVYASLTAPDLQKVWLCDDALGDVRIGGHYVLTWGNGHTVSGTYTALEPDHHLTMTWWERGETAAREIEIDLQAEGASTVISVKNGSDLWQSALENLAYTLETGLDYRVMKVPMLGIIPGTPLNDKLIEDLKLPVREGQHLSGVVPGMGAEAAGLQANDVIVSLGGKDVVDFPSLRAAVSNYVGGDTVTVEYYREGQKYSVEMTLSKRPLPEWPLDMAGLTARLEQEFATLDRELDELLATTNPDEMSRKPAPDQWSGNEVLAHVIWSERWLHQILWRYEFNLDEIEFPGNPPSEIAAILSVHPTTDSLVEELKRAERSTLAMTAALKPSKVFAARFALGEPSMIAHTRNHYKQIREALEMVRQVVVS